MIFLDYFSSLFAIQNLKTPQNPTSNSTHLKIPRKSLLNWKFWIYILCKNGQDFSILNILHNGTERFELFLLCKKCHNFNILHIGTERFELLYFVKSVKTWTYWVLTVTILVHPLQNISVKEKLGRFSEVSFTDKYSKFGVSSKYRNKLGAFSRICWD